MPAKQKTGTHMAKSFSFSSGLSSILFWSVISAAFIGPGTVTTTAKAGSAFGLQLLWALVFSIVGTLVLQEAAARLTLGSGKSLGGVLAVRYGEKIGIRWGLLLILVLGCTAYQAGNLLGATEGLALLGFEDRKGPATILAGLAILVLLSGNIRRVARFLGLVVALMGFAFLYLAAKGGIPRMGTSGSFSEMNWLALGLIGTTLVPYNLFLASGISRGQGLREMRVGLAGAILIGGLISIAILLVGTQLNGPFDFQALRLALEKGLGPAGGTFLAFGLLAAGFTSSVTAPLAAAVTARSLLGEAWKEHGWRYRMVWLGVLMTGLLFVWLEVKPIPAIIAAQGLNGLLLPAVALFLYAAMNDRRIMPDGYRNNRFQNILFLLVVAVVLILGGNQVVQAISRIGPG
jgi:Mn2+/Fe2+ NRAMP family transporter